MTGTASNQLRSAWVAETTAGTTPSTPAFTTNDVAINMTATPTMVESKTQHAGGARSGVSVGALPVSGSMAGPLIYGNYDGWLESMLQGAWSTNVLKDGKAVKSFTVENTLPAGAGGTSTMMRFRGVEATNGSITMASQADVQFSLDLTGMGSDDATTTAITGATYTDPTNATPLTSGVDVGTITYAGYTLDCFETSTINLAYENRDAQPKLGSTDMCGITRGAFIPTITARAYIEGNFLAIYNAARANHSTFAVTYTIGSVSGSKYTLLFPRCSFGGGDIDVSGASAMQDITIMPQYDTTEDCVLKVTRAVS
jgi:hypothetical protein